MQIVTTAIAKSDTTDVAVIGEDVDLAVLFIAKTPEERDSLLLKPGRGKVKTSIYSTQKMQTLHAFTGCVTTSAAFRKSKLNSIRFHQKHLDIQKAVDVFYRPSATHTEVSEDEVS